jgi:hypothetical protein
MWRRRHDDRHVASAGHPQEGMKYLAACLSPMDLQRGIDVFRQQVLRLYRDEDAATARVALHSSRHCDDLILVHCKRG